MRGHYHYTDSGLYVYVRKGFGRARVMKSVEIPPASPGYIVRQIVSKHEGPYYVDLVSAKDAARALKNVSFLLSKMTWHASLIVDM